jgi:hypothetical protein
VTPLFRILVPASALIAMTAQAQVATDFELGAAYCLGTFLGTDVVSDANKARDMTCKSIANAQEAKLCREAQRLSTELVDQRIRDSYRLKAYLTAKGLLGANEQSLIIVEVIKRGKDDAQHWTTIIDREITACSPCSNACPIMPTEQNSACLRQCVEKLDVDNYLGRASRCQDIVKALPF